MKLDFLPPSVLVDDVEHQFCLHCHAETVRWYQGTDGRRHCACSTCERVADRCVVLDPEITWWRDDDGEYWHATAGVFVQERGPRFLFFDRIAHPFGLTIPAGHVNAGEESRDAAKRELNEETGLTADRLRYITETPIVGDECRRGADAHRWHVYHQMSSRATVVLNEEGDSPVWLSLDDALSKPLTYAVRQLITRFRQQLII